MNYDLLIGLTVALSAAVRGNWSPCGESLQAQLHPMGEQSRGNRWGVTIAAFTLGSAGAGSLLGAAAGGVGNLTFGPAGGSLSIVALCAVIAGLLDLFGPRPWTPKRQVNENWIGRYRGWVYGVAFGIQLGLGFTVFVMSWGYYAMLAISFVSGSTWVGAVVGSSFGLGRGILLYMSKGITSTDSLVRFHGAMAQLKGPVFRATALVTTAFGIVALATAL